MPQVSIIIPVYNVEKYLKKCLNSVINQTYTDWECIVIDDGSTDFCKMICDNYARKDDRFRVVHQKNQGVSHARNIGIEMAQGEFLSFIDPDDYIDTEFIKALITEQARYNADIVIANTLPFLDDCRYKAPETASLMAGLMVGRLLYNSDFCLLNSKREIADSIFHLSGSCWGKLCKKKIWEKIRFPENISWGEDTFTVYEMICNAESICKAETAVYCYRMLREGSLSRRKMPLEKRNLIAQSWQDSCDSMIKANPYVKEKIAWLYNKGVRCLQIHAL